MLNERELHYVEIKDGAESGTAAEPRAKGVLSIVLGALSVLLPGIIGIILGAVAKRIGSPVILNFEGSPSARLSRIGRILGNVGIAVSLVDLLIGVACICAAVAAVIFII